MGFEPGRDAVRKTHSSRDFVRPTSRSRLCPAMDQIELDAAISALAASGVEARNAAAASLLAAEPEPVLRTLAARLEAMDMHSKAAAAVNTLVSFAWERGPSGWRKVAGEVLIDPLMAAARHQNEYVRSTAVDALSYLGDEAPEATEKLLPIYIAALDDASTWVQQSACLALKRLGSAAAPATEKLASLVASYVDAYACNALGAIGPAAAAAAPALRRAARAGDSERRTAAREALDRIEGPKPAAPPKVPKPAKPAAPKADFGKRKQLETKDDVLGVAFDPTGEWLAAVTGPEVRIYALDGALLRTLAIPAHGTGVAIAPDGTLIAVSGTDAKVYMLEAAAGTLRATLEGHQLAFEKARQSLAFSADGALIAAGGDRGVTIWKVTGGAPVRWISKMSVTHVDVDGDRIAVSGSSGMDVYLISDGSAAGRAYVHRNAGAGVFGPDPETVFIAKLGTKEVELRRLAGDATLVSRSTTAKLHGVAVSPDRTLFAAYSYKAIDLWRGPELEPAGALTISKGAQVAVALRDDAVAAADVRSVSLWRR